MVLILLRLFGVVWFFGFLLLAASATSSFLYSNESQPARTDRWHSRLRMSLLWPLALLSANGRARLRRG